jgi:hypothetical protein
VYFFTICSIALGESGFPNLERNNPLATLPIGSYVLEGKEAELRKLSS